MACRQELLRRSRRSHLQVGEGLVDRVAWALGMRLCCWNLPAAEWEPRGTGDSSGSLTVRPAPLPPYQGLPRKQILPENTGRTQT